MNASNENHERNTVDDLHDRLIDVSLNELVGDQPPPDQSARILAAIPEPRAIANRVSHFPWLSMAVAAILLIGATILLLPAVQPAREASRSSAKRDRLGSAPVVAVQQKSSIASRQYSRAESQQLPQRIAKSVNGGSEQTPALQKQPTRSRMSASSYDVGGQEPTAAPALVGKQWSVQSGYKPLFATLPSGKSKETEEGIGLNGLIDDLNAPQQIALSHPSQSASMEHEKLLDVGFDAFGGARHGREILPEIKTSQGTGPGLSGDQYTRIYENPFIKAEGGDAVSTFSIDVDTASYANVRQFLMQMNTLPPPDAVRIEELINYFDYDYAGPKADDEAPFAAHVEVASCPWKTDHRLVRIGIKGRELDRTKRPQSNLVFLIDVSGSMDESNKLPLVLYGLEQLTRELGENDRVAIVVYASSEGLVLSSTRGSNQQAILAALEQLKAGGSTAGGAGIQLAYQIAEDNFIKGGTNRVILCTDGDFNVGVTSTAELERLVEKKAKDTGVFLSVLGFGRGNLNDAMMEAISNHGNGNYHYVDNRSESRRVLVEEMTGTLVTIAKDVKIQVEFNPRQVAGYRLIGYENRMLRTEDFNDDTKDAGEIGAGHTVTALYEVGPAGQKVDVSPADDLKYQPTDNPTAGKPSEVGKSADVSGELLTLKMRYKAPEGDVSKKLEWSVTDGQQGFTAASGDFQFAAAVAGFGLLLRDSQYKGNLTFAAILELAQGGTGDDKRGHRAEFLEMVKRAKALRKE